MKKGLKYLISALIFAVALMLGVGCSENGFLDQATCDHVYGLGKITREATCDRYGERTFTCKECGYKEKEKIDKIEHTPVLVEESAPTCTVAGFEKYKCAGCGAMWKHVIAKTAHNYSETLTYNETHHWYPCFICGGAEEEMLIAHTLTKSHDDDYHWFTCSDCPYKSEEEEHTGSYEYVGTPYPSYEHSHLFNPDCCDRAFPTERCEGEWKTVGTIGVDIKDVKICKCGTKLEEFYTANVDENGEEIVTEVDLNLADLANGETKATFSLEEAISFIILEQFFIGFDLYYQGECLYNEETIMEYFEVMPATIFDNVLGEHVLEFVIYTDVARTEAHTVTLKINVINIHNHVDEDIDYTCDDCGADYYIFEDESKYTEVDVADGELVAGNWYRLYRPANGTSIMTKYALNVEWIGSIAEATIFLGACPWESNIQCGREGYTGYLYAFSSSGKLFKEMKCWITEDYIDVYIEAGTYTYEDMPGATATITSETTISLGDYGEYIKRLVVN